MKYQNEKSTDEKVMASVAPVLQQLDGPDMSQTIDAMRGAQDPVLVGDYTNSSFYYPSHDAEQSKYESFRNANSHMGYHNEKSTDEKIMASVAPVLKQLDGPDMSQTIDAMRGAQDPLTVKDLASYSPSHPSHGIEDPARFDFDQRAGNIGLNKHTAEPPTTKEFALALGNTTSETINNARKGAENNLQSASTQLGPEISAASEVCTRGINDAFNISRQARERALAEQTKTIGPVMNKTSDVARDKINDTVDIAENSIDVLNKAWTPAATTAADLCAKSINDTWSKLTGKANPRTDTTTDTTALESSSVSQVPLQSNVDIIQSASAAAH